MTKDNQDLLKLYEQIQQDRRWGMVKDCVLTTLMVLPTLYMIWQNHKKNRLSPKRRLMRNKAAQARDKLNHETTQAKLQLEEKIILREAAHENELKRMETGLDSSQTGLEAEEGQDLLATLKQKGQSLWSDKISQANKIADNTIKQAQATVKDKLKVDKITSLLDKDKKEKG